MYDMNNECYDDEMVFSLTDIIDAICKRKVMIIALFILFTVPVFAYLLVAPRSYESRTTLLFFPPEASAIGAKSDLVFALDTYVSLATANDLLEDVIFSVYKGEKPEEIPTPRMLRERMTVKLGASEKMGGKEDKDVSIHQIGLTVSVKDKSPEMSVKLLNAWSEVFIKRHSQLFDDKNAASTAYMGTTLAQVKADLEKVENDLMTYRKKTMVPIVETDMALAKSQYDSSLKQYTNDITELPVLEAKVKIVKKLLAVEEEKKSLTRGMSKEALWQFLSQSLNEQELKSLGNLNIRDEFINGHYTSLKGQAIDLEIAITTVKTRINNLKKIVAESKGKYVKIYSELMEANKEIERLQREKDTLQGTYNSLYKEYHVLSLAANEKSDPVKVVEKPVAPREPVARGGAKKLLLAGFAGIFMGCVLALLMEAVEAERKRKAEAK